MLTLFIDPAALSTERQKELTLKACADVGAKCDFVSQRVERTISWQPPLSAEDSVCEDIRKEVLLVIQIEQVISLIHSYVQCKKGEANEGLTLSEYVKSVQLALSNHNLTVIIVGLTRYFSDQKKGIRQKYKEAVAGPPVKGKKKKIADTSNRITALEAEEAFVEVQLLIGCVVQHADTEEELAAMLKLYTKAVMEKPAKKDRFGKTFSFLEEGATGVSVNKQGVGLSKVWKHQLMQFKNMGPEMAVAVQGVYPSPFLLYQVCQQCTSKEAEKLLGDINVRRNASVISTNRKIGKEQARRIYTFITSSNPDQIIK